MDEMINETTELEDVTTEDNEVMPSFDEDISLGGAILRIAGPLAIGVVIGGVVAPAAKKLIDSARIGIVNFLMKDDKDHVVVEVINSEDKKDSTEE